MTGEKYERVYSGPTIYVCTGCGDWIAIPSSVKSQGPLLGIRDLFIKNHFKRDGTYCEGPVGMEQG